MIAESPLQSTAPESLKALASRLGHEFAEPTLLVEAITHRSAGSNHNERLEFLGDGVLNFVIAAALFERRPDVPEGDLSRMRASLVRESTLAEIARELDLGSFLRLGSGELRSGGFRRASILADALEAIFGAVFRDAGFAAGEGLILRLFAERLDNLPDAGMLKDAKTRLQEWLQARGRALPGYRIVSETGEAHERHFIACCRLSDTDEQTQGEGSGRRRAEQAAAQRMLERLVDD